MLNSQGKDIMGLQINLNDADAILFADLTKRHCASDTDYSPRPPSLRSLAATLHTLIGDDRMTSTVPARLVKVFANLMSSNRAEICN